MQQYPQQSVHHVERPVPESKVEEWLLQQPSGSAQPPDLTEQLQAVRLGARRQVLQEALQAMTLQRWSSEDLTMDDVSVQVGQLTSLTKHGCVTASCTLTIITHVYCSCLLFCPTLFTAHTYYKAAGAAALCTQSAIFGFVNTTNWHLPF